MRNLIAGALLGIALASCAAVGRWLDEPSTAPPGTVEAGGGVVVTGPAPGTEPVVVDLPGGSGTVAVTPLAGEPTTSGESLVSTVAGIAGSVNPLLGFGVAALGKLGLEALSRRGRGGGAA